MDTSILEKIAELEIAGQLQKDGLLVAKPLSDQLGTDLIVFDKINDGVKFCRIQSKGRSFSNSKSTNVEISKHYVTKGFITFLYLRFNDSQDGLYMFVANDVSAWKSVKDKYVLRLSSGTAMKKLEFYKYESAKANIIRGIIRVAETHNEFRDMIYGSAKLELPMLEMKGSMV